MSILDSSEDVDVFLLRLLREVIPWQYGRKEIRPEMSLQNDLGIDSLGKLAVAFRLEEECGVDLRAFSGNIADIRTVGDLLDVAKGLVGKSRSE